jgi:glucose/arabinose dehydrogenase
MKTILLWVIAIVGIIIIASAGKFAYDNLRGARVAFGPVTKDITTLFPSASSTLSPAQNISGFPLSVPAGFSLSLFAKNLGAPRVLVWDPKGTLLVSIPSEGRVVALPDTNGDGMSDETVTVAKGLNLPHGLAFHDGKLYIAETNAVAIYEYDQASYRATNRKKIIDLPGNGNHFSRTIRFGPDGRLYTAIGSTCNVCNEKDNRRAKIFVSNPDGSDFHTYASGLRNAVFFAWSPFDQRMWATNMGRDLLGDDTPPDTVNIVTEGKNFGWPYCYGKNIWDRTFDGSAKAEAFCKTVEPSHIDMQAHSAPLGLAFVPKSWPTQYQNSLLVALHGSWNRSVPTGYKIVRFVLDEKGDYVRTEDFLTGWIQNGGALGRPVDLLFNSEGSLYISDDKAGVIYRLSVIQK